MPRLTQTISHRPGRGGEPPRGGHVPAYLAMEYATEAYHLALAQWCGEVLTPGHMAIRSLSGDFRRELLVGDAEFDVSIEAIGRTSLTLSIAMSQGGEPAATATMVLVRLTDGRSRAYPFDDAQRALLERADSAARAVS